MNKRQKTSLIGYFFGPSGDGRGIIRKSVLMIGALTLLFLSFFLYLLLSRSPLDLIILPNKSFSPRIAQDGSLVNSYILSVRNRGRSDMDLQITVHVTGGSVKIAPSSLLQVKAGMLKKIPVYLSIKESEAQQLADTIAVTLGSRESEQLKITRKARFLRPEG